MNRSRVLPARLLGRKPGGGRVEVLLLRQAGHESEWEGFVRPGRRLRTGARVEVGEGLRVHVASEAREPDGRRLLRLESPGPVPEALERWGHTPLPPYVRRPDRPADRERYQTIFARERGSVAAPTAGLHFTPRLLSALAARGVDLAEVLLHVGPGTFRPVQVEDVEAHRVAAEPFRVPPETAAAVRSTRARGGRVVAVGTTAVRALESAAGEGGEVVPAAGETDLVIVPGYRFRVVDALLTNFHLPRSSLLLLVAAFASREAVLAAYSEAVERGYRFYSYGDAMLVA